MCDYYWPAKSPMIAWICFSFTPVPQTDLKHFNLKSSLGKAWPPGKLSLGGFYCLPDSRSHGYIGEACSIRLLTICCCIQWCIPCYFVLTPQLVFLSAFDTDAATNESMSQEHIKMYKDWIAAWSIWNRSRYYYNMRCHWGRWYGSVNLVGRRGLQSGCKIIQMTTFCLSWSSIKY